MKKLIFVLTCAFLTCCAPNTEKVVVKGEKGDSGTNGVDAVSMGLDLKQTATSCSNGGATLKTFVDTIPNGVLDVGEAVKETVVVCNGKDGTNGVNGQDGDSVTVTTATVQQCPTGGVVLNGSQTICNGMDGSMGPQGIQGLTGAQGPRGEAGVDGVAGAVGPVGPMGPQGISGSVGSITPVQLCNGDTGAYKEYGLLIGSQLFAVYYTPTQSFLALLSAGTYVTTNGANCQFTYSNNGSSITLTGPSGSTTVPVAPASSNLTLVWKTCTVKNNGKKNPTTTTGYFLFDGEHYYAADNSNSEKEDFVKVTCQ